MNELRPPTAQAAGWSSFAAPGWNLVTIAAAGSWIILALLSVAAGLLWRAGGYAPPMLSLIDGIGLALWLIALFIEPAWDALQSMQSRSFIPAMGARYRHYLLAAGVAAFAVPLSLTFLGTLLAYDTRVYVARVLTLSQLDLPVPAGAFFALVLLLAGPAVICLSLALLSAGRSWLGRTAGTAVWAAGMLLLNSGLLWTTDSSSGLSLGRLAEVLRDRLNLVNLDPTKGMYVSDLLVELLLLPAAALALCIVLLAWTALRSWPARPLTRLQTGWLAALAGLAAVCGSAWLNSENWHFNSGISSPGSWDSLLCIGATALICGFAVLRWSAGGRTQTAGSFTHLAWGLAVIPAWAAYTLPNVFAGQVNQQLVLALLGATAFVCATFLVATCMIDVVFTGHPLGRHAAYLVLLALAAVPIDPEYGTVVTMLIRQLNQAIAYPEYRELALPMAAVQLGVILFGLWQLAKRPAAWRPRRSGRVKSRQ